MKNIKKLNQSGFTLIEILMAVLVIGILAAVAITQFVNFSKDAKDAATKSNLATLRNGIAAQSAMERIRCARVSGDFPNLATLVANDITNSAAAGACLFSSVVNPATGAAFASKAVLNTTYITLADAKFSATGIPIQTWGVGTGATIAVNTIAADNETVAGTCDTKGVGPTGATGFTCVAHLAFAAIAAEVGWCYCVHTGEIWANSAANNGLNTGTGNEFTF